MTDKDIQSWKFITFVTHNSRVSERMTEYNTSQFIKNLKPYILEFENRIIITECIAEQCKKHNLKIASWNVLPDHVHMVIAAKNKKDLDKKVQLIKGGSSFLYQRKLNIDKRTQIIWAQKYHVEEIPTENDLKNILHYINNNHYKHAERWGNNLITEYEIGLKSIIDENCIDVDSIY